MRQAKAAEMRPESFLLDDVTAAAITRLAALYGTSRSGAVRRMVQAEYDRVRDMLPRVARNGN